MIGVYTVGSFVDDFGNLVAPYTLSSFMARRAYFNGGDYE